MTNVPYWRGVAATLLAIVLATGGLGLAAPLLSSNSDLLIMLVYLLAINLVTHVWGMRNGLLAASLAFLTYNFFFIEPVGTFHVNRSSDLLVLFAFLLFAVLNSQWLGQARAQKLRAEYRERDTTMLYETSLALSNIYDLDEALRSIAQRIQSVLAANAIEISVDSESLKSRVVYPTARLTLVTPLAMPQSLDLLSSQGVIGKIVINRPHPLTEGELHLVRTFAGLTTLAVERIRAMRAEAKTRAFEESDRLKSALLSSVSHELRTPLAAIQAGTESLHHQIIDANSAQGRDLIANMDDAVRHLGKLVSNLLDMSRIEAGALKPMHEWSDLSEVIYGVAARLRTELSEHMIDIQIRNDFPLVWCDPIQIGQVVSNLLSNSAKYAPPHTTILATVELIAQDSAAHTTQWVQVQVHNASEHIPAEYRNRIFDKFFRVTHAERILGTGLGLSICKGIVEAHGGQIWVQNDKSQPNGVTFAFTLPYHAHQMQPLPELE